ncbi:MAG: hypothetical protein ACTSYI_05540, partial [Promethearchaeota archaeon]
EEQQLQTLLDQYIFCEESKIEILTNRWNKVELSYIYCRNHGKQKTKKFMKDFLKNFQILDRLELDDLASDLKCQFPIALADCFSIASSIIIGCPVVFYHEQELTEKIIEALVETYSIEILII